MSAGADAPIRAPGVAERPRRGARREAILEATVRLLATRGLAAVTHRSVAAEADVPLAATTYYFASKDELLAEALELLAAAEVERISEVAARLGEQISPESAAAAVVEALVPDAAAERALIAKYEVLVAAARREHLRPAVASLQSALRGLAEAVLRSAGAPDPENSARLLVAGAHGIVLEHLAGDAESAGPAGMEARFRPLFETLTRPAD